MTNTISSILNTPISAEMSPSSNPQPRPATAPADSSAASQSEAVTLSAAAQTTTQLLTAARNADGINQSAVDQIRGALQAGTYNVAPEDLAQAIATVLKESN
jgi:flagellar biosynthesis anti-sigma factor FlgM